MDIFCIPMKRSFVYLAYVVDWFIYQVLAWRASIIHEVNFCIEAAKEGHARHDEPNIFNTDQGGRFTAITFAQVLKDTNITISMDGKEASRDDVLSKGCGEPPNMKRIICTPIATFRRTACLSEIFGPPTIPNFLTPRLTARHPIRLTSMRCRQQRWWHNKGQAYL
jgi:hypothetical protein